MDTVEDNLEDTSVSPAGGQAKKPFVDTQRGHRQKIPSYNTPSCSFLLVRPIQ
jgi:hypothetical protein